MPLFLFILIFITYIHSFAHNTFIRRHSLKPLSISSSPMCSVGKTSLWCRAENRIRACLTASRRAADWATPHHNWATLRFAFFASSFFHFAFSFIFVSLLIIYFALIFFIFEVFRLHANKASVSLLFAFMKNERRTPRHDRPNEPTNEGPLSFVLSESPFNKQQGPPPL